MPKRQTKCLQHLSLGFEFQHLFNAVAVQKVAHQWMPDMAAMHPNLVCPTCLQAHFQQGELVTNTFADAPMRSCRTSAILNPHAIPMFRITSDGGINRSRIGGKAS